MTEVRYLRVQVIDSQGNIIGGGQVVESQYLKIHIVDSQGNIIDSLGSGDGIPLAQKGAPGGVAELDDNRTVPDNRIPATITRDSELSTALATKADSNSLTSHINNFSNPHSVTASQVGALATGTRGQPNGVAPLNASSKIESQYFPTPLTATILFRQGLFNEYSPTLFAVNEPFYATDLDVLLINGRSYIKLEQLQALEARVAALEAA